MNDHSRVPTHGPTLTQAILAAFTPASLPAAAVFRAAQAGTSETDRGLLALAQGLGLSEATLAAIALATALETHPEVPARLRALQGEAFGPWPALATLAGILPQLGVDTPSPLPNLTRAFDLGILIRVGDRAPAPEERFALSPAMLAALDLPVSDAGITALPAPDLPPDWTHAAQTTAQTLAPGTCLVLRLGEPADKRAFAAGIAAALGRTPRDVTGCPMGAGVAARLAGWLPVHTIKSTMGTRSPLPSLPGYDGPRLAILNSDGGLEPDPDWPLIDAALPRALPSDDPLWSLGPHRRRAVAARILADPAHNQRAALGQDYRASMEPHAQLVPEPIGAQDFIAAETTRRDLDILVARCRYALSGLGTRGVKAMFSGPSGTGKTLAASYLSTALELPLFRLDLSTVVSKYIGETEENLAQLLDHAEGGHLVLLMDEADSLFAGRTDVTDGSARFANNQTNFLLTRFEAFTGLAILTTNSPEKIDTAFARRLDQVVEVHPPAARERRALLRVHLGDGHGLGDADLNRIAAHVDLAGGHLKNLVHTARVLAAAEGAPITIDHLTVGIAQEYAKIGRNPPSEFAR